MFFTLNNLIHNSKIESLLKLWVLITFLKSIKNIFSNSTKILLRNNSKQTNPKDTIISSDSLDFIQKWFKFSNIPAHSASKISFFFMYKKCNVHTISIKRENWVHAFKG